jgi:hypothetical protein
MGRENLTTHFITHLYHQGGLLSPLRNDGAITENQWQFMTVTISNSDSTVRTYKNGALFGTNKMAAPLSNNHRVNNWLGRSAWSADEYFQGKMDEVRISRLPHSAAWIRLSYETQKPDQAVVSLRPPPRCQSNFAPPADTSIQEGASLALAAGADCSESYSWSSVSGPSPRILDPFVKTLQIGAPRVAGDALLVYKFTATFGDTLKEKEVRVTVREAIPEPIFTLPAALAWNGKDSLRVAPVITNLSAVRASSDSVIAWRWELAGFAADTALRPGAILLLGSASSGTGSLNLCLSNNGPAVCGSVEITIGQSTGIPARPKAVVGDITAAPVSARDARGRLHPARDGGMVRFPFRAAPTE